MKTTTQLANHFRQVYFGGNWTAVNLKDQLADVTWQQATTKVYTLNTIAILVFHMHYYVRAVTKVLEGQPLDAKDEYSFAHPPITSQVEWKQWLDTIWIEAEQFATLMEALPEAKLPDVFSEEKYGTYFRNFQGIIEHTHYHLGQITVIKKVLQKVT